MTTIGSLFSGIGGLELGLERATGAHTIWQVEQDDWCRKVLARHWPHATRFDDVCTASALPAVDIMCGGFPCQDVSLAGKGAGLDGARSGLWREFDRLICEVRPKVVVVENVAALAGRGLARVLVDLAESGYMGSWNVVTAASVGAPHLRRRLFIVAADTDRVQLRDERWWSEAWARAAIPRLARSSRDVADANLQHLDVSAGPEREHLPVAAWTGEQGTAPHPDGETGRREAGNALFAPCGCPTCIGQVQPRRRSGGADAPTVAGIWCGWLPASAVRRVDDGLPDGVDRPRRRRPAADGKRLKALGNAVVPQVAEVVGRVVSDLLASPERTAP